MALYIIKRPESEVQALAEALLEAKTKVGLCSVCYHLSADPVCEICRSPNRDDRTICVVADSKDVIALERTHEYRGKYHVLGGVIDPMDGLGPDELNITSLVRRVSQQTFEEVIIAINPNVEGETTTLYLGQLLKPFSVRVTRIAYGLAVGSELDCADELTLARAMDGRRELD